MLKNTVRRAKKLFNVSPSRLRELWDQHYNEITQFEIMVKDTWEKVPSCLMSTVAHGVEHHLSRSEVFNITFDKNATLGKMSIPLSSLSLSIHRTLGFVRTFENQAPIVDGEDQQSRIVEVSSFTQVFSLSRYIYKGIERP